MDGSFHEWKTKEARRKQRAAGNDAAAAAAAAGGGGGATNAKDGKGKDGAIPPSSSNANAAQRSDTTTNTWPLPPSQQSQQPQQQQQQQHGWNGKGPASHSYDDHQSTSRRSNYPSSHYRGSSGGYEPLQQQYQQQHPPYFPAGAPSSSMEQMSASAPSQRPRSDHGGDMLPAGGAMGGATNHPNHPITAQLEAMAGRGGPRTRDGGGRAAEVPMHPNDRFDGRRRSRSFERDNRALPRGPPPPLPPPQQSGRSPSPGRQYHYPNQGAGFQRGQPPRGSDASGGGYGGP